MATMTVPLVRCPSESPPLCRERPPMPEKEVVIAVFGCPLLKVDTSSSSQRCIGESRPKSETFEQSSPGTSFLCTRFLRQRHDDFAAAVREQRSQAERYVVPELAKKSMYFGSTRRTTGDGIRLRYHVMERTCISPTLGPTPSKKAPEQAETSANTRPLSGITLEELKALQPIASAIMTRDVEIVGQNACLSKRSRGRTDESREAFTSEGEKMPEGLTVRGFIGVIDPTRAYEDINVQIAFLRQCYSAFQALGSGVAMAVAVTKCDLLSEEALASIEQRLSCGVAIGEQVPCYYVSSLKGLGVCTVFEDVARRAMSIPGESPRAWTYDLLAKARQQTLQNCSKTYAQSVVKQITESLVVSWWETFRESLFEEDKSRENGDGQALSGGRALKTLVSFQGEVVCREAFLEQLSDVVGHMLVESRVQDAETHVFLASEGMARYRERVQRLVGRHRDTVIRRHAVRRTSSEESSRGHSPSPLTSPAQKSSGPFTTKSTSPNTSPKTSPAVTPKFSITHRQPNSALPTPPLPDQHKELVLPHMVVERPDGYSKLQPVDRKQVHSGSDRLSDNTLHNYTPLSNLARSVSPQPYMFLVNKQAEGNPGEASTLFDPAEASKPAEPFYAVLEQTIPAEDNVQVEPIYSLLDNVSQRPSSPDWHSTGQGPCHSSVDQSSPATSTSSDGFDNNVQHHTYETIPNFPLLKKAP